MSNTRKRRSTRPSRTAVGVVAPARCDCLHDYELDGRCHRPASVRVTSVCQAEGCDCAAAVHLLCLHCLEIWRTKAGQGGLEVRVRPL